MSDLHEYRFIELRSEGRTIHGEALRYGDLADIGGVFKEEALPMSLQSSGDVMLNLFHDRSRPLAREGNGLMVMSSQQAFSFRADLPDTSYTRQALEFIQNGLVKGASVEFLVKRDEWLNGGEHRVIHEAVVHGIGLVDKPAYPKSSIAVRHAAIGHLEQPPRHIRWL